MPLEQRAKISASLKGRMPKFIPNNKERRHSAQYKIDVGNRKRGSRHTEATKRLMSEVHKRVWATGGHPITPEAIQKMRDANTGPRNHLWKGGVTSLNQKIRHSTPYREWRKHVFQRDDYTCQACGQRGGILQADHELPFSQFPDLRFEILNGRTLCVSCHKKTPTYGGRIHNAA